MRTLDVDGLVLTRVQPSDDLALRQWHELRTVVALTDEPDGPPPCPEFERATIRRPEPGSEGIRWLAAVTGQDGRAEVVGGCALHLPLLDNPDNAAAEVLVAPRFRRRGVGTALVRHLRAEALRHGRRRLIIDGVQPLDRGAEDPAGRFGAAVGATLALTEIRRRLDLSTLDGAALSRLQAQARSKAAGYSLVQWVGATPPQWADAIAYLNGRMVTDAPMGELDWEPEHYDADRLRGREQSCLAGGALLLTTGAVHDATGDLVAFSLIIGYASAPWHGEQWETIVDPRHRGHRLGTLVKIANLGYARALRPELRTIDTSNAESNLHMIRINEAMGFRPFGRYGQWQLDLR